MRIYFPKIIFVKDHLRHLIRPYMFIKTIAAKAIYYYINKLDREF